MLDIMIRGGSSIDKSTGAMSLNLVKRVVTSSRTSGTSGGGSQETSCTISVYTSLVSWGLQIKVLVRTKATCFAKRVGVTLPLEEDAHSSFGGAGLRQIF